MLVSLEVLRFQCLRRLESKEVKLGIVSNAKGPSNPPIRMLRKKSSIALRKVDFPALFAPIRMFMRLSCTEPESAKDLRSLI